MARIHVLSEAVANKIAAGEVEAFCGRERQGSRHPSFSRNWAGAGARSRKPERSEASLKVYG
jgi:hypothetical protein